MAQFTYNETSTSDELTTLEDLYIEQLRNLYSAETHILKALPKMVSTATTPELREGFQRHLGQTKEHAERLEQIFDRIGLTPTGHVCKAMQGLIAEMDERIGEGEPSAVLDAGLIAAAQRIEHYEISAYGTARRLAKQVGDRASIGPLTETLDEEAETDEHLSSVADTILKSESQDSNR